MSELVQVALIAALVPATVSVLIFSVGKYFELQSKKEDNREWYKRTLFEKRLAAVQQAYTWWTRLNEVVKRSRNPASDPKLVENVKELAQQAREWYDMNSVCLDFPGKGLSDFLSLTREASRRADGDNSINIETSLDDYYKIIRGKINSLLSLEKESPWEPRTNDR